MSIESPEPREPEPRLIEMPKWDNPAQRRELPDTPEADKEGVKPFAVGEAVSVSRSNGGIDRIGWVVESTNPALTVVVNPEKGIGKTLNTSELLALQDRLDAQIERDLGYNPKETTRVKMAGRAFSVVGPDNPAAAESLTDNSDDAMSMSEFRKIYPATEVPAVDMPSIPTNLVEVSDSKQSAQPAESVETPAQSQEAGPEAQVDKEADKARLKKELDDIEASVPESDREGLWRYAIARFGFEQDSALKQISETTKSRGAHRQYARAYNELKAL